MYLSSHQNSLKIPEWPSRKLWKIDFPINQKLLDIRMKTMENVFWRLEFEWKVVTKIFVLSNIAWLFSHRENTYRKVFCPNNIQDILTSSGYQYLLVHHFLFIQRVSCYVFEKWFSKQRTCYDAR